MKDRRTQRQKAERQTDRKTERRNDGETERRKHRISRIVGKLAKECNIKSKKTYFNQHSGITTK